MDASLNEVVENRTLVTPEPVTQEPNTKTLDTPLEKTIQVLGFRVSVINLYLGQSARLAIHMNCICGDKSYIEYKELVIEGEEYSNWGSDDKYIIDLVTSRMNTLL